MPTLLETRIIKQIRDHVINQCRYVFPSEYDKHSDEMYAEGDCMTDHEVKMLINADVNPALSDEALLALAESVEEVQVWFDDEDWLSRVSNYLIKNAEHFKVLHDLLLDRVLNPPPDDPFPHFDWNV